MATPIGTLGTIPTITIGGRVFTDLTTLKILSGIATTTNYYSTLRSANATAGYQVTNGTTLTILAAKLIAGAVGGTGYANLNYGDTDVGLDSSSAPTNVVQNCGASGIRAVALATGTSGASYISDPFVGAFAVPSQKYPSAIFLSGTHTIMVYGYEA